MTKKLKYSFFFFIWQLEVAQKLREKENAFLNRINKIHKVEDKKWNFSLQIF